MKTHVTERLPRMTIADAASRLRDGTRSSVDLVDGQPGGDRRASTPTRNAFIRVRRATRRSAAARRADAELRAGHDRGPLHGIPISLKDLIDVAGQPTTAASRVLADRDRRGRRADRHAAARGRRRPARQDQPARVRARHDQRGLGVRRGAAPARSRRDRPAARAAAPPWRWRPAWASRRSARDTGGSIRIPASCCGVVGLKPGHGEIPTDGVIPLSVSLDHVGPLALTVQDAALALGRAPWGQTGGQTGVRRAATGARACACAA